MPSPEIGDRDLEMIPSGDRVPLAVKTCVRPSISRFTGESGGGGTTIVVDSSRS